MATPQDATVELTTQGFSLIFQQGIAFVVLGLAILLLGAGLVYVFMLYNKQVVNTAALVDKFYQASIEQTRVIAAFTQRLDDVIRK